jgi:hypothetical protein
MKISRRNFLSGVAVVPALAFSSPGFGAGAVHSSTPLPGAAVAPAAATNRIVIGASPEAGMFKNLAMTLSSFASSNGYAFPALLDNNGYPTSTPANGIYTVFSIPSTINVSDQIVVKFSGTGSIMLARGAPGFTIVSGNNFVSGATSYNLSVVGTDARVVFRFATSVSASLTFAFPAGGKFANMSNLVICKLSDEAAIDSATTPEQLLDDNYVAIYQALNAGVFRPMDWSRINSGNVSQSRYIANWRSSINTSSQRWAPGAWAGATSGVNAYICAAQPDATKNYVDGEMIQLQFASANTQAAVTINSGGRGPIPILVGAGGYVGQAPSAGSIAVNSLATLTYDAILNAFLWQTGGQTGCIPYELQIAFSNRLNAHYWCNLPSYIDDASVSAIAALVKDKLSPSLNAYFEYSNEVWNFGFPATGWAWKKGVALGFPTDNNRSFFGWYALRFCQTMGLVAKAWGPRSSTQLRKVMAFQAFGDAGSISSYRFQGADLSGAKYADYAKRGFADYNVAPNRPIDLCDVLSYATYYSGAQCTNFDANYISNGAANTADLLAAADNYASAVPSKMDSALAFIESDIRAGKLVNGKAGGQTLLALNTTANGTGIYASWSTHATTFNKAVECYEGGHESWYPSVSACTSMGISTAYGGPTGKIAVLLNAFKMTEAFRAVVQDQIVQFLAKPKSTRAAWLCLPGVSQWGLSNGDAYAAKFKSWDGLVALNK